MAKNDNLKDFLTDVADAIREKKGMSDPINPQDFSAEIASIQSGGGGLEEKDVNFYECDGTLLYSYTKEEALALTEMPAIPEYIGPDGQPMAHDGWNYSYDEMIAQVLGSDLADIGVQRTVEDSLFELEFDDESSHAVQCQFEIGDFSATIDWGDGTSSSVIGDTSAAKIISHSYAEGYSSRVVIKVRVTKGTPTLGYSVESTSGTTTTYDFFAATRGAVNLVSAYIAENTVITAGAFKSAINLRTVVSHVVSFSGKLKLQAFVVKKGDSLRGAAFQNCTGLKVLSIPVATALNLQCLASTFLNRVVVPYGCILNSTAVFGNCYAKKIHMSRDIINTLSLSSTFANAVNISDITIPATIRFLDALYGQSIFSSCYNLKRVKFEGDSVALGAQCFLNCSQLRVIDLRHTTAAATLTTSAFSGCITSELKIVVPDSLVDTYKKATNWVSYPNSIIGATEYDALNS